MNDKILYELLYEYLRKGLSNFSFNVDMVKVEPEMIWDLFTSSIFLREHFGEVKHLMRSIVKEIDRKDKLKCQYCRIDEGFFVDSPLRAEELCKKHLQEYEERYVDRTLTQKHPATSEIIGREGDSCAPPRKRHAT